MIIGDLHTHSTFSDGQLCIKDLVDYYGTRNIKILAITDHLCDSISILGKGAHILGITLKESNFEEYLETIAQEAIRAEKKYGMLLIPGVEFTKNSLNSNFSAHFLSLGIKKFINPNLGIEEILKQTKNQDCINIVAHPVSTRVKERQTHYFWNNRHKYKTLFDAWEVASGSHLFQEVLKEDILKIANSDFHKPEHFSSWKTSFQCNLTLESVFQSIINQEISFCYFEDEIKVKIKNQFLLFPQKSILLRG